MGYRMKQRESNFSIDKKNFVEVLKAIKKLARTKLNPQNDIASFDDFDWVDTYKFIQADTLDEALAAWRWEPEYNKKGDICYINFRGQKLGDDQILFDAIASFVKKGSYIEMDGEEGDIWRWVFDKGECHEITATITF